MRAGVSARRSDDGSVCAQASSALGYYLLVSLRPGGAARLPQGPWCRDGWPPGKHLSLVLNRRPSHAQGDCHQVDACHLHLLDSMVLLSRVCDCGTAQAIPIGAWRYKPKPNCRGTCKVGGRALSRRALLRALSQISRLAVGVCERGLPGAVAVNKPVQYRACRDVPRALTATAQGPICSILV
jgi:hypothetical protein